MSLRPWMPLFVGDYTTATQHLSLAEDGAYLRLLMHCWTTEKPIPLDLDRVYRITKAFSNSEKEAVRSVLEQFFEKTSDGFRNNRLEKIMIEQESRIDRLTENGKKGGRPKIKPKENQEDNQTQNQNDNQEHNLKITMSDSDSKSESESKSESNTLTVCARDEAAVAFVNSAKGYAVASRNTNMHNFSWLAGYLTQQFQEIRNSRPDIPAEAVLKVWQECCDDASSKAVGASKWYRKVFENRIASWTPLSRQKAQVSPSVGKYCALPGNQIVPTEAREGGLVEF